jgi:hypothetical protein
MTTLGRISITDNIAASPLSPISNNTMSFDRPCATKSRLSSQLDDFLAQLDKVAMSCKRTDKAKTTTEVSTPPHSSAFKKRSLDDMVLVTEEDFETLRRKKNPRNLSPAPQHVQGSFLLTATGLPMIRATSIGELSSYNEQCVVSNDEELEMFVSPKGTFRCGLPPAPRRTRVVPPSA